ncbi:MAG: M48 family metallopeptidase [Bacteroidales bacterium]|jgi:STE24 endopeptidase|nr:M48 family metallopeptidase [Bacteroidales bacterium]
MTNILFICIIVIICADYAIERFLDYINAKHRKTALPAELQDIYNAEEYEKQQRYEEAKSNISFWSSTLSTVVILALLFCSAFAWLDTWIYATFGSAAQPLNHIWAGLLFFGILGFAADILGKPFEIYNTFVIEQRFGFNKTTAKLFVFDTLKSWLLAALLGAAVLAALLALMSYFGEWFWLYAWVFISLIMIAITMFYSSLIVPLFNKQTPLEDGELKQAIAEFASNVGFKLDTIFVIDGSKRSTKANAYFSGLGAKKRIVLYDTLIQEMTVDEIVAVLAHEIGHYKKKHTRSMILASLLQMGVMLFVLGLCVRVPQFTEALGVPYEQGKYHIALLVFALLYTPLSFAISLVFNYVSRTHEFEADAYAAQHYSAESLSQALRKLSKRNLSNLTPHPWYVFCYYSHPDLYQRLQALKQLKVEN